MKINGIDIEVAAIDFDGTLFEEKYPEIGSPIRGTIEFVKYLKEEGVQLILHTNREGKLLEDAVEACKSVGIEFDAINQNLQWRIDTWGESRKIGADVYIDDKAYNPNNIPENILYRIYNEDSLRREYETNHYFKDAIDLIMEQNGDFMPALHVLAKTLNEYEMVGIMKRYPASDLLM